MCGINDLKTERDIETGVISGDVAFRDLDEGKRLLGGSGLKKRASLDSLR